MLPPLPPPMPSRALARTCGAGSLAPRSSGRRLAPHPHSHSLTLGFSLLLRNQSGLQVFGINRAFVMNLLEAVQGDTDLAAARSRVPALSHLSPLFPESPALQSVFESLFTYINVLLIPLCLAIFGTLRLMRRNQRRGLN